MRVLGASIVKAVDVDAIDEKFGVFVIVADLKRVPEAVAAVIAIHGDVSCPIATNTGEYDHPSQLRGHGSAGLDRATHVMSMMIFCLEITWFSAVAWKFAMGVPHESGFSFEGALPGSLSSFGIFPLFRPKNQIRTP